MSDGPKDAASKGVVDLDLTLSSIRAGSTECKSGCGGSLILVNQKRTDPAPPCDPLRTVAYESWMFRETSDTVLHHRRDLPTDVIRFAIVEDAVLHARSLCELFLCLGGEDAISVKHLFPDLDRNIEKYAPLRNKTKRLRKEYRQHNGRPYDYETLFNTRVLHPTVFRGKYGLYREPLTRLRPQLLAIVDEIAALAQSFGGG
jgi:hypothetical protein